MAPPIIVYAILIEHAMAALILLIIAGLTDGLDGYWAKRFNQATKIGAYLDPIADKLMLLGMIIALFIIDQVPLYLFLAVVFRDVIIVGGAIAYELVTHRLLRRDPRVKTLIPFSYSEQLQSYRLILKGQDETWLPDWFLRRGLQLTHMENGWVAR